MDCKRCSENDRGIFNENDNSIGDDNISNNFRNNRLKLLALFIVTLIVFSFRTFVIQRIVVRGESMLPSFEDENVVLIKKFDNDYERFDVVVVKVNGKLMIKRIIGMPNETLIIKNGYVYINGEKLEYDYGYQTNIYGCAESEIYIPENEYFLLGDNRNHSSDSRDWNTVSTEQIKGKVFIKIFPYWEIETY